MLTLLIHSALVVLGYMSLLFVIAHFRKDNSIADVGWGIGFILIAVYGLFLTGTFFPRQILVCIMVIVWGLRLALHVGARNRSHGEDPRYAKWRAEWGKYVVIRSFLQVFMLQGLFMMLISLPVIMVHAFPAERLFRTDYLGLGLWMTGLYWEAVGDRQLRTFLSDPANKGKIMDKGLWRYTRHPNYFGESVLWWGIFLLAVQLPLWYVSLAGPVVITFLLLKVSGVPMLEEEFKGNEAFRNYVRRTSSFFPMRPGKE